jgi:hypothetical protein
MKFDIDRFAKLSGMRTTAETTKNTAPATPSSVLKESAGRLAESAEIKNLRNIIRSETRAILAANKTSKKVSDDALVEGVQRSKSLTEAMKTLGFLGPGFGGNNAFAQGGTMTSASRFASLNEEDEMGVLPYGDEPLVESDGMPGALANQLHFAAIEKVHGLKEDFLNKILSLDEETLDLIAEVLGNEKEREELRSILNPKGQTGAFDQKQSGYDY